MSGIDFEKIIPVPSGLWMGGINPDTRARYGKNNWLDWSVANWGTKWNVFCFDDDDQYSDSKITFVTANNAPAPIMQKLSEMYPDITMRHQWADDNVGHNCGERVYMAGSIIEEFKPEPGVQVVDYACKIMGTTPADHCLKLNEGGMEYVCAEEEDMFSVPRGYTDGFNQWCKQIAALCLTAFLQTTLLFLGMLSIQSNTFLGLGIMLAANEVPRIAQQFGLDSSVRFSIMPIVQTTSTAVNIGSAIAKAKRGGT